MEKNKLFNSIYLAPTSELVRNKNGQYNIRSATVHDYFNLCNLTECHKEIHTNIILDEANMLTAEQMKIILKNWKLKQANLFILYNDRQLPPPIKKSLPITTID